jgi:hypothetical protein
MKTVTEGRMSRSNSITLVAAAFLVLPLYAQAADGFYTFRVSSPLIASGSAGLRFGDDTDRFRPSAEIEAGVGGGRILVGLDSLGDGPGLGLKPAFLRTWLDPAGVDAGRSYVGVVLQVGYDRFFAEAGGFGQVGDDDDGDDWLGSLGLGLLF